MAISSCSCLSQTLSLHSNPPFLPKHNPAKINLFSISPNPKHHKIFSIHIIPFANHNNFFEFNHNKTRIKPNCTSPDHGELDLTNSSSHINITKTTTSTNNNNKLILICSAITIALAISNRVLYKLALVPMKEYPFFLAQLNTFGYVIIYVSILYIRYNAGIVTDEMMAIPKFRFVIIGLLEALGVVAGMSSGAMLPGPAIPVLSQTFLLWQLAFSTILLGRRYSLNKIAGCLLVAVGVVIAVVSGSDSGQMLSGIGVMWPLLMVASSAFQAGASILKESVFIDATKRLKGKLLDIFVVNSFGSGFQALFVLLCLPLLSNLKGIPFSQLHLYIKSGAGCFFNIGANTTGCDGAPLLPVLYIITNIAFNISLLNLVKISSAVVSSLAVLLSVPLSIYILALPLPYLPEGVTLSPYFLWGSVVLVMGLVLYNIPNMSRNSGST
ncbi:protein CLT2, chloroplastic [Apium graveolens]|uniref:protein CLT2, chloroplastic n=1 Tax=Apium graveolens TaxID=4045 RepID=UPI003D797519